MCDVVCTSLAASWLETGWPRELYVRAVVLISAHCVPCQTSTWGGSPLGRSLATLESLLLCSICSETMKIPVLLLKCGHSYCR